MNKQPKNRKTDKNKTPRPKLVKVGEKTASAIETEALRPVLSEGASVATAAESASHSTRSRVERIVRESVEVSLGFLDLPKQKDIDRISDLIVILEQQLKATQAGLARNLSERTRQLESKDVALSRVIEEYESVYPMAMLAAVVPSLAHDLATPIGNSNMAASYMRERLNKFQELIVAGTLRRSDLQEFLKVIADGLDIVEKGGRVVGELVASLKQMSIDQATERRRQFALVEVVNEALITLSPSFRRKPWKLEKDISPELNLDSYPGPLAQVITNLVQNAIVHGFDGRESGTVRLTAIALDEVRLRILISDDGLGMSQKVLSKLFTPFFTTKGGQGGSGIGLSYSKRLVEEILGGTITAESTLGKGSHFIIDLPLRAPEKAA